MKKKLMALFVALMVMLSVSGTAFASEGQVRASHYLDSYYVTLVAKGNGKMAVGVAINGVDKEDAIGMREIYIETKIDGKWHYFDTLDYIEHPEFLAYDTDAYVDTAYFYGTPGDTYRVTITAYAEKDGGWDTGYVTSYSEVCL